MKTGVHSQGSTSVEPEDVSETSLLAEEHDADSLRSIEILASIEVALQVSIEQVQMKRMINLEGIYEVLEEAKARPISGRQRIGRNQNQLMRGIHEFNSFPS